MPSALEGPERSSQGAARHQELTLGLVDGGHDVLAFGPEERVGELPHPFPLTFDRVGDDVELGGDAGGIGVAGHAAKLEQPPRRPNPFRRRGSRSVASGA